MRAWHPRRFDVEAPSAAAIGPDVTVALNGAVTVQMPDSELPSGPIALQYAAGVVKFRKVQIKPL